MTKNCFQRRIVLNLMLSWKEVLEFQILSLMCHDDDWSADFVLHTSFGIEELGYALTYLDSSFHGNMYHSIIMLFSIAVY